MYYQGGGENIELASTEENLRAFYNAENAYMVLNTLLMPGASNERARLKEENKKFDVIMLDYMDELITVYCHLYSAMCKYTANCERGKRYYTYRIDRMNSLEFLKQGQMHSFMSTMVNKEENTDFCDKNGLLLLEIDAGADIEHVDVNAVLGEESKYPHESEILYAPYVLLDREPINMTNEELSYRDMNDEAPKAKYLLHLRMSGITAQEISADNSELKSLYEEIVDISSLRNAKQVWKIFMQKEEPAPDILENYLLWKEKLQIYLKLRFSEIKGKIMHEKNNNNGRLLKLKRDIEHYSDYSEINRKKYEKKVEISGLLTIFLYPAATIALSFSYMEVPWMKTVSLIMTSIGTVIPIIVKYFAWGEKLQQRTDTFLKLDELKRDLDYETNLDEEMVNRFVDRYKEIVREDNRMGRNNSSLQTKYLKDTFLTKDKN